MKCFEYILTKFISFYCLFCLMDPQGNLRRIIDLNEANSFIKVSTKHLIGAKCRYAKTFTISP